MVAPALTARQSEILDSFVSGGCDLPALAERLGIPFSDLLDWASTPAVAARIADLHRFAEAAMALRLCLERSAALTTLGQVARSSPDMVERRRAATSILRGPWTPRPARPRPDSTDPAPRSPDRPRATPVRSVVSGASAGRTAPPRKAPGASAAVSPPQSPHIPTLPPVSLAGLPLSVETSTLELPIRLSPAGALAARSGLLPDTS